jgi:aryl-alcohol dehydrogenase-like predicted oxidoreductase
MLLLLISHCLTLTRAKMLSVGSIPWSPLARGLLTRPAEERTDDPSSRNKTDAGLIYGTQVYVGNGGEETIKRCALR